MAKSAIFHFRNVFLIRPLVFCWGQDALKALREQEDDRLDADLAGGVSRGAL